MKKRKARAPQRRPAPSRPKRPAVAELIRSTALRLKRAKVVFAHGTSDRFTHEWKQQIATYGLLALSLHREEFDDPTLARFRIGGIVGDKRRQPVKNFAE